MAISQGDFVIFPHARLFPMLVKAVKMISGLGAAAHMGRSYLAKGLKTDAAQFSGYIRDTELLCKEAIYYVKTAMAGISLSESPVWGTAEDLKGSIPKSFAIYCNQVAESEMSTEVMEFVVRAMGVGNMAITGLQDAAKYAVTSDNAERRGRIVACIQDEVTGLNKKFEGYVDSISAETTKEELSGMIKEDLYKTKIQEVYLAIKAEEEQEEAEAKQNEDLFNLGS